MTVTFGEPVEVPPVEGVEVAHRRRLRAYRAEDKASANVPAEPLGGTLADAQRYVDRIVRSAWWRRNCIGTPVVKVVVEETRGSSAWAYYGTEEMRGGLRMGIKLGRRALRNQPTIADPWIILHELSHLLASRAGHHGHGREFARYYLLAVQRWLGDDAARALRASYAEEGVRYRATTRRKR